MKKSVWGPLIWNFLHVLSIKIKENEFLNNRDIIINFIFSICDNLPCPTCASHARGYLKKINFNFIKSKEHLIKSLWSMHNEVNKQNKKEEFKYENIFEVYSKYNFENCAILFFKSMSNMNYGDRMMIYSFQRTKFIQKFVPIVRNNLHWFD